MAWTGRLPHPYPHAPPVSPSVLALPVLWRGFSLAVLAADEGRAGTRTMPDEAPPTIEPTSEPICEQCGGALEQLTRLPKFDHPAFDIFRCIGCGVVSWIAQEAE